MSQNQDEIDEIPSIVPERDELVSHRKRKRGTSASGGPPPRQDYVEADTSGWVIFFITMLCLGLLGSGGVAYYFYKQGQATQDELLSTHNRLMQIESRLNLVDQAAADSAQSLVEKVEFNFSEIDKLWAARNTLRTEVTELATLVAAWKTTAGELETAVGNHENLLSQNMTAIQARIEEINRNFAGMDNLGQQLTVLNADLNRVKTSMATVEMDVENRLITVEQDIESINVYRLQVNQTLTALQNSINTLQQRVGQ